MSLVLIAAQQRYNGRMESLSPRGADDRLTRRGTSPAISARLFFKQTQTTPTLRYLVTTGSPRHAIGSPVEFRCCPVSRSPERKKRMYEPDVGRQSGLMKGRTSCAQ